MLLASLGLPKGYLPGSVWLITQKESSPGGSEVLLLKAWFPSKVVHQGAGAISRGWFCGDLSVEGWK